MKGKAVVGSLLMGLALPSYAMASVSLPTTLSHPKGDNQLNAIEVAQSYVSLSQVVNVLYNSRQQIFNMAYGYSGNDVRWDSISVDNFSNQLRLNLHGKIMIRRKPPIRIGLYLQSDGRGNFYFVGYDWDTGKRCRSICRRRVREKLQNLPREYPRFNNVLRNLIYS